MSLHQISLVVEEGALVRAALDKVTVPFPKFDHGNPTGHKGLIDLPVDALVQAAPNLHCLCLGLTEYDASRLSFPTAPLINLRRLFFDVSCNLHSMLLTEIVSNAPKLEFLALHWAGFTRMYEMRFHSGEAVVRCTTGVWDVIQPCRDSLRELRVHISDYIKSELPEERDSPRDFRRLEVLKLNDHALSALYDAWKKKNRYTREPDSFLSSILPPMIRGVTFWDLNGLAMRAAMQSFARVAAFGAFGYLDKVTVAPSEAKYGPNSPWYNWRTWADAEAELEENFTKAGASFELVKSDEVIIWGWDFRLDPLALPSRVRAVIQRLSVEECKGDIELLRRSYARMLKKGNWQTLRIDAKRNS